MKKSVWLVAAGTMFFVGCQSETVMDQRHFVPVAEDDPAPMESVKPVQPIVAPEAQIKETAPATSDIPTFEPMKGVKSSDGISGEVTGSGKGGVYVVKSGDTLGKIAKKNGVKLADLMAANNLTEADAKKLQVGKKLTIPAGGKAVAATPKAAKASASAAPAATLDKDGYYVVQSGDFPEKIAKKNGVKLADLMKANNLTPDSARRLQIGDKLIIPGKSAATAAPAVKPADDTKSEPQDITPAVAPADIPPADATPEATPAEPESVEDTEISLVSAERISIADFCKKYGISEDEFRLHNRNVTDPLLQGTTVFIKKK